MKVLQYVMLVMSDQNEMKLLMILVQMLLKE